jgi:tight adherence protein B
MNFRIPLLLLLASFCLAGLLVSYNMVQQAQRRRARFRARMAATLKSTPSHLPASNVMTQVRVSVPVVKKTLIDRIAGLIGADLTRAELYPIKWWMVPLVALLPARLAALLIEFLTGPLGVLVTPICCWAICYNFFQFCHNRRINILFKQFPDALAMIVRSVRVGIPVSESVRSVARQATEPTSEVFAKLADDIAIGTPLDEALRNMAERNKVAEYRFFATALSLQSQTGGGISETLENLADVIRKRVAARARGKALAAEARASATALAILPILAMVALWLMNPSYMMILFTNHLGNQILAAGALLLGFGIFVMKLIIQKSLT